MWYLLDSNAIIDIFREHEKVTNKYQLASIKRSEIAICSIVYYEIVRGFKKSEATKKLELFLNDCNNWKIFPLNKEAIEKAIEICVNLPRGITIEDNDIYIAAIAMVNDCTLVTANERHFGRIENLKCINWRK